MQWKKQNRASRFTVDSLDDPALVNLRKAIAIHNDVQYMESGPYRTPTYFRVVVMPRGGKRNRYSATTLQKGANHYDVYVYRRAHAMSNKRPNWLEALYAKAA